MKRVVKYALAALVAISTPALAETSTEIEQLRKELKELQQQVDAVSKSQPKQEKGFYTPEVFGAMMATLNVGTYDGLTRFNVRNSRFGVRGNASRDLSYQMQIDFHNQGSVSVLDAFMQYKRGNFSFMLGQQRINLSEDMRRGPSGSLFTTRCFTAIASTAYLSGSNGSYSLKSLGSRDIGAYADYTFFKEGCVPVNWGVGVFNGTGLNNAEWGRSVNVTTRVVLGDLKSGVSGGGSLYVGKNRLREDMTIWTGEVRYVADDLFVESTFQQRRLNRDGVQRLSAANIQGYYNIELKKSDLFEYISPTLRWDMGHNLDYLLEDADGVVYDATNIDVNRLTAAMNLRFTGAKFRARMMLGYEFFFTDSRLEDEMYNELMQDKFTMALICAF